VEATAGLCQKINTNIEVQPIRERFRFSTDTGTAVFCCVDKIDIRRFIWRSLENETSFFVDGRMSGEVIRVLTAADGKSREHYPTTLFAAGEAQEGRCTARSSIFTANIAAGLMIEQFSRWLRRIPVDPDLQLNLLSSELTVTDPA
jgi:sulfur carrier protein ThiS adenylyltransferase